jgi:hypothetical protein
MLNLLPQEQKNLLKKEYSNRRIVVWLGLIMCVLVISLILLAPSYFLTRMKAEQVRTELENTKRSLDAEMPPAEIVAELEAAVRHAEALKPLVKQQSLYELLQIFESKPNTIRITGLSFRGGTNGKSIIELKGKAVDRESLTGFGRALEGRAEFETVDLPVSNFVKEKDIEFSMIVTLK